MPARDASSGCQLKPDLKGNRGEKPRIHSLLHTHRTAGEKEPGQGIREEHSGELEPVVPAVWRLIENGLCGAGSVRG